MIVLAPGGNEAVEICALPPANLTVPRLVEPVVNVTIPVAETPASVFTAAENVNDWPNLEGFLDELSVVVESAGFVVSSVADEVLLA